MQAEIVTVESSKKVKGLEIYRTEDNGTPVPAEDPRYKKSAAAYAVTDAKNRRYEQSVKNLHEKAVQDDPLSGWIIAGAIGAAFAPVIVYGGPPLAAALGAVAVKGLVKILVRSTVKQCSLALCA